MAKKTLIMENQVIKGDFEWKDELHSEITFTKNDKGKFTLTLIEADKIICNHEFEKVTKYCFKCKNCGEKRWLPIHGF